MKKPSFTKSLIALLLFLSPYYLFSQTFVTAATTSTPTDGAAATNPGPTVALTPPASAQTGDLVVIFAQYKTISTTLAIGNAGGQVWNSTTANSGSNQTTRVFWCRFNGNWTPATLSVTGGAAGVPLSASIYVFRPANSNHMWVLNAGPTNTTNAAATTLNASAITTTTGNTVTMAFWAVSAANTWTATVAGTGWSKTGINNQYRNTTGSGESHTAAYNLQTGTGGSTLAQPSQTQSASTAGLTTTLSWAEAPQNDDCSNATLITSAASCINGTSNLTGQTLYSATASGASATSTCAATDNADVWYKFVAQSKFPTVTLSNLGASWTTRLKVQILSGTCGGTLTEVGCGNNTAPVTPFSIQPSVAGGLTIGNTYYIRIQKSNTGAATGGAAAWAFDICVNDGPVNNDCSNAALITSATTCIAGTSSLTGQTLDMASADGGTITSSCTAMNNPDVWYKFVAQTKYPTITLSNFGASWTNKLKVQLLSGTCGGSFTEVGCGNNTGSTSTFTILPSVAGGLTVGNTYYIRIQKNNTGTPTGGAAAWAFDICVNDGPSNNDWANAALITSATSCIEGTSSLTGQTLDMASADGGTIGSSCTAMNNADVWYKFVAQTKYPTITLSNFGASWGTRLKVQLLSGTFGSFTEVGCGNNTGPTSPFFVNPSGAGLTVGTTYYIRILKNNTGTPTGGTAAWAFDICVNDGPSNNDCENAALITSATTCIAGTSNLTNQTLDMATADGSTIASGCTATNTPDVWYKFVAQSQYPIVMLTNFGSNWSNRLKVQLLSGTCGSFTEVGCGNNSSPFPSISIIPAGSGLTVGDTYYVRIQKNNTGTPTGGAATWAFDICVTDPASTGSGRMNEVFKQTILSGPNILADPWEITYGRDNKLWVTESKGYKVYRIDPQTGAKTMVLDISDNSTFLGPDTANIRSRSNNGASAQGGLAGLALHPNFMDGTANETNYVYISYVFSKDSASVFNSGCIFFKNKLVRFVYDKVNDRLTTPVVLCDTLPGGNDHNSQRIIIAPVGSKNYLFYANGDMGAGQLACQWRVEKAQMINSYEGKILRFNLDTDNDSPTLSALDNWIPNDNPYNALLSKQSAVWAIGIRNNQGFAYDTALHILYGSSHGPYSDDEINIIEPFRNYGHPIVIGYASDGNYNGTTGQGLNTSITAGVPFPTNNGVGSLPPIGDEMANKATIDASGHGLYKDPLFSAYAAPNGDINTAGTVKYIWKNNPGNASPAPGWPSEAWSGLDLYSNSTIPGWKKSLIAASLKWGRLVRIRLGTSGIVTVPSNDSINNASDTISYFGSQNRFRDLAFAPNGRDIYVVMDRSTTTSGPSAQWPVVPTCQGCLQKYTFLGYNNGSGNRSTIPSSIDVAQGIANSFQIANKVVINAANSNNNLWVPITDTSSNVVAEINARGNDLDTVTTILFTRTGASRTTNGLKYVNRNVTIKPQQQPADSVWIRLYISKAEFDQFVTDGGVGSISQLKIIKNEDPAKTAIALPTIMANTNISESFNGNSYVLQGTIGEFSSFYFSNSAIIPLPLNLLTFKGSLQNNATLLEWETANEINTSHFVVERSTDGHNFQQIATVVAVGNTAVNNKYSYIDNDVTRQSSSVVYYRLKVIDNDGSYNYSDIVTIALPVSTSKVALFPNPASHEVNVTITTTIDGKVKWQLVDNTGRILNHNSITAKKGNNNIVINLNRLSAGTYFLIVSGADIDQKVKLEKL